MTTSILTISICFVVTSLLTRSVYWNFKCSQIYKEAGHLLPYSDNTWTASVVWWSEFLATDPEARVRFPALPDFLRKKKKENSSGSGTVSTQPREYN
jgi:hypothetical protein